MRTKSDFIRAQGPQLPAAEVVKRARAEGLALSTQLVYVTRSLDKQRLLKRSKPMGISAFSKSRGTRAAFFADASAREFLGLVTDIGLSRAEKLLVKFKSDLASIDLR